MGQVRSERGERQAQPLFTAEAAHSLRSTGGKEGREGRHLLPWLRAGYGDPTIEEAPFSCSHRGNVTHFKNASGRGEDHIHQRQSRSFERGNKMIARQFEERKKSRGNALGWGWQHVLEKERNASHDRGKS